MLRFAKEQRWLIIHLIKMLLRKQIARLDESLAAPFSYFPAQEMSESNTGLLFSLRAQLFSLSGDAKKSCKTSVFAKLRNFSSLSSLISSVFENMKLIS